jgi:DNA-directed RNA polymerase subunit RPC12/RpoP
MSLVYIRINTDCNAPGCPCEIVPEHANGRVNQDLDPILVQTDWDYPSVASSFGWSTTAVQQCRKCRKALDVSEEDGDEAVQCSECGFRKRKAKQNVFCLHDGTDGTVPCPSCGLDAGTFIAAAYDFLRDNDGLRVPDPGYFGN